MRVFITGATGFIGSIIVRDLLAAGHQVLGLARSDKAAAELTAAGAQVHRGSLEDLESLRSGAQGVDGILHTGFIHDFQDFSKFREVCELDRRVIETLGSVLVGSDRPFIVTSGTGMGSLGPGQLAIEDHFDTNNPNPRSASEFAVNAVGEKGVNVSVVRLPQVHDTVKQGLVTYLVEIARQQGSSAYIGNGLNRWPAVHRMAAAQVYELALENATAGARYHAVAEEGVAMREVAESIGRGLKIPVVSLSPEEAAEHFGWMAMFAGFDMPASSTLTQERLNWKPTGPGLIDDLDNMKYSDS